MTSVALCVTFIRSFLVSNLHWYLKMKIVDISHYYSNHQKMMTFMSIHVILLKEWIDFPSGSVCSLRFISLVEQGFYIKPASSALQCHLEHFSPSDKICQYLILNSLCKAKDEKQTLLHVICSSLVLLIKETLNSISEKTTCNKLTNFVLTRRLHLINFTIDILQ